MVKEEKSYQIHMQRSKSDSHLRVQKRILKQKFMQAIRKEHGAASNEYTEAMKYVAEGAECDLRKLIDSFSAILNLFVNSSNEQFSHLNSRLEGNDTRMSPLDIGP